MNLIDGIREGYEEIAFPLYEGEAGNTFVRISELPGYEDVHGAIFFNTDTLTVFDAERGKEIGTSKSNTDGYEQVRLRRHKGRARRTYVHKLSATVHCGRGPLPSEQCRHLDGNRDNNKLGNVVFGTSKENGEDKRRHGRGRKKLTERETHLIAAKSHALAEKPHQRKGRITSYGIAQEFGISTKLRGAIGAGIRYPRAGLPSEDEEGIIISLTEGTVITWDSDGTETELK